MKKTTVTTNKIERLFKEYATLFFDLKDSQIEQSFDENFPLFKGQGRKDFQISEGFNEVDYQVDFHYHLNEDGTICAMISLNVDGEPIRTLTN